MEIKDVPSSKTPLSQQDYDTLLARLNLLEMEKEDLAHSNTSLSEENLGLNQKLAALQSHNTHLLDMLRQSRQARFGRSSEKLDPSTSPVLPGLEQVFDEDGTESLDSSKESEKKDADPSQKRKASGGRKPLAPTLPREEVAHDLKEEDKVCDCCGGALHRIGEETSEQIEVVPAKVKVLRHVRIKYGCEGCENTVKLAEAPQQPIPKSNAGPGLLAHILVSKYDDHLPLYRQAEIWQRLGVDLDRGTMGRWVIQCADLLNPLVEKMKETLRLSDYLQADETSVQVLNEPRRKKHQKSYMWVYKTSEGEGSTIVYAYGPERASWVASAFLGDFKGYLQTDGYSGYKKICADSKKASVDSKKAIVGVGCWAHARRKFMDIVKIWKKPEKGLAHEAVDRIGKLYEIERQAREKKLDYESLKALRTKEALPILKELKLWLEEQRPRIPPKSPLGVAIGYTLNNWVELTRYLEDGRLQIDNNGVERAIRPFAVGRKNWMFKGSVKGAEAGAVIYSLLETAKSYGHNPIEYFTDILKKIPLGENLDTLMPNAWKTPSTND